MVVERTDDAIRFASVTGSVTGVVDFCSCAFVVVAFVDDFVVVEGDCFMIVVASTCLDVACFTTSFFLSIGWVIAVGDVDV